MGMDIQRPDISRVRKVRQMVYLLLALILTGSVAIGVSRLRPAGPVVSRAAIWTDQVKRGSMLREVHGVGTLVPEKIRWIPAQSDSRVERIALRPGAEVKPNSIILELTNPELKRAALDAEYELKAAEADYQSLEAQLTNELLNQKAAAAAVRSDYEQAKIQHDVDVTLRAQGLGADVSEKISRVKTEQLGVRLQLEEDRTRNAA